MPFDPSAHRDPADAWAVGPDGARYWGLDGAAGLVAYDPARGVLVQHRAAWSHQGGTWGIPGGARHRGEAAISGALREAREEAGVPAESLRVTATSTLDLGFWSYTTVIARVIAGFDPHAGDDESEELAWVPADRVDALELHPGFASAWPRLRTMLDVMPVVVIDAANVVGSVPDGWWRDRRGAAQRLIDRLDHWAVRGQDGAALGLPQARWFCEVEAVLEGAARGAAGGRVTVVDAPASGDDALVDRVRTRAAAGERVTLVTSDRGLAARVEGHARVVGASWLLESLGRE